jgi:hypothetical protein
MLRITFWMLAILIIAVSCKKKDDATPQPTAVDSYHTIPAGKTWCNGPTDPTQQMVSANSYVNVIEKNPNYKQKVLFIDHGDTLGPYILSNDAYTAWRKFYCLGDYDIFKWKTTDTSGNNWTDWKTDTIRYQVKRELDL